MDLSQFRDIVEKDGGKIIIVENGKPAMVLLSFEEYKSKLAKEDSGKKEPGLESERLKETAAPSGEMYRDASEELTIEDLPF